ncbi:MAG: hypothetical protein HY836_12730 [Aquabacterium sp.]|uniref:hypothetical protein n=1 Tax=Aquabacterium sp. TaxID=1872578 RepID=UPI0025BCAF36|nr:hypothetical protein [Aquabacterium sp.]MBI5926447.1 hypothetical protein [Aquabacterium sp.]
MDTNTPPPKPSLPAGLSLIEKAQELRWTLQLSVGVLFADLVLVHYTGQNISHWSTSADQLLSNSGFLVTSLLMFGVLMSIVMPLSAELCRQIGWQLIIHVPWPDWMRTTRDYQRPSGKVYPDELHRHALEKSDKLLLDIYTMHNQKQAEGNAAKLATAQAIFSVVVLSAANYFADCFGMQGATLLQSAATTLGEYGELIGTVGGLFAFAAVKAAWYPAGSSDWIYYPPLYREIMEERKKNH